MQNSPTPLSMQEHLHPVLLPLLHCLSLTGVLQQDVTAFLIHHGHAYTAEHCAQVAAEARRVAELAGEDPRLAEMAGWLHDFSRWTSVLR